MSISLSLFQIKNEAKEIINQTLNTNSWREINYHPQEYLVLLNELKSQMEVVEIKINDKWKCHLCEEAHVGIYVHIETGYSVFVWCI